MTTTDRTPDSACTEFSKAAASRRQFLAGVLGTAGTLGTVMATQGVFSQAAWGGTPGGDVVVVLSQRGGADALSLVVPHGDPGYYAARPSTNIPKANVLGLDSMFGLHPSLAPLLPMYQSGQLGIVHAAGMATPNRSHFEAMAVVEDAAPGTSIRTGWINRMLGLDGAGSVATDAVQLGSNQAPLAFSGARPSLSMPNLNAPGWGQWVTADANWQARFHDAYRSVWSGYTGRAATAATAAFTAQDALVRIAANTYAPAAGVSYPAGDLGAALLQAARLIKADIGTRVITIDHGDWDMHVNLGDLTSGEFKDHAREWANGIAAFVADLGSLMSRVTIVSMTEFGRRVAQNGDRGVDHGWGQAMFAIGAGIRGGKVYGTWPGLAPDQLTNGDLTVTTDYRHVLAELMRNRMGTDPTKVLPNFSPQPLGLIGA